MVKHHILLSIWISPYVEFLLSTMQNLQQHPENPEYQNIHRQIHDATHLKVILKWLLQLLLKSVTDRFCWF